ncbi:MAG: molybdate ABC transporter substrate-binding protein [Gammaproteobacteria bacterium]|jgi:molybdate transport system substrate-binding protein|nr:molybdate ABC transporter substrate-binding protein [Gammaproteobacteria bacterium]MBT4606287.1 molybdate ABC transporter substrate-binding protein [Thiotrichales bacterium]MBT3472921.1 molybdate ABC transporter substrate-binding protein [Gammaproteobacteria bacterium]MBT3965968.1 molybdate ABC transporter substrate-binding protein [Gammaproteobacteria bacterium]MBT4079626.1 molybdate ABC transporter substrate-binding protein [Gammaproteobacteria bacterium]
MLRTIALLCGLWTVGLAQASEIRVAVASNFITAATALGQQFEADSGHKVKFSVGSTGKHYAQIHHGAPFDLFFAADSLRPQRLEEEGVARLGSRFTYALGQLVLWSPKADLIDDQGSVLTQGGFRYLAVANPKLAPYGKAAEQLLEKRKLIGKLRGRMVRGENVGQTFHFVKSGNAELGLVAYSQAKQQTGSFWLVPQSLYSPIEQQAVQLSEHPVASAFIDFVRSDVGLEIIRSYGYRTPHD